MIHASNASVPAGQRSAEELDAQANQVAKRYALTAGASELIPGKVIVDIVADSAVQWLMIQHIGTIYGYQVNRQDVIKLISVTLDSSVDQLLQKILEKAGKLVSVGVSGVWTYYYTLVLGYTVKRIFRKAYLENSQPDFTSNTKRFIGESIREVLSEIGSAWKRILFQEEFILRRYEVDLLKLQQEMSAAAYEDAEVAKASRRAWEAFKQHDIELSRVTDTMIEDLYRMAERRGGPEKLDRQPAVLR